MTNQQLLKRITCNHPMMGGGKPVIEGTRLTVEYVLNLLAQSSTIQEILDEYEGLQAEDIQACLLFASQSSCQVPRSCHWLRNRYRCGSSWTELVMSFALIHLSDIHYRPGWNENHGVVFRAFFKDLKKQLQFLETKNLYFVLSGDVVQSGDDLEPYNQFFSKFDSELKSLDVPKNKRMKKVDHEGVISQELAETPFNDYAEKPSDVFQGKFHLYRDFENRFADYGSLANSLGGGGWEIEDDVGIYCLNTAFFSTGGIKDGDPPTNKDKRRLAVKRLAARHS